MNRSQALEKLQTIQNLPALPSIVLEVNRLLQDVDASIDQLVKMLEKEQSLVMKLLKLVNSSFYGFKNKVNSLRHAVTLMGYNTIQNAVVTIAIVDALQFTKNLNNFKIDLFWQHAIRVAVMNRYLAARTRLVPVEEAFTAGLIHDIGKVVLVNFFPQDLMTVLREIQTANISFCQAETKLAICPHSIIGSYLARRWMLPESLVEAIGHHHDMGSAEKPQEALTAMVGFSNSLVHIMDEDAGYHLPTLQGHEGIRDLIIDVLRDGNQWLVDIRGEMDAACSFFNKG